ncbi:MAG: hypothetical protein Q9163_003917 [Psora crenata]
MRVLFAFFQLIAIKVIAVPIIITADNPRAPGASIVLTSFKFAGGSDDWINHVRNRNDKVDAVTLASARLGFKTGVTCETSDASPDIQDCIRAFETLKVAPALRPLQGYKDGTWWAAYVNSCALAIYYQEDWTDDCKATLKDIGDYASAIFQGCQSPGNGKVGGKSQFGMDKCAARIEVIGTSGEPPQGEAHGS